MTKCEKCGEPAIFHPAEGPRCIKCFSDETSRMLGFYDLKHGVPPEDDDCDPTYDYDRYEVSTPEWKASWVLSAWESRFPDTLTPDMRFLLWHFIKDSY